MKRKKRDELLVRLGRAAGQAEVMQQFIGFFIRSLPEDWTSPGMTREEAARAFQEHWRKNKECLEEEIAKMLGHAPDPGVVEALRWYRMVVAAFAHGGGDGPGRDLVVDRGQRAAKALERIEKK